MSFLGSKQQLATTFSIELQSISTMAADPNPRATNQDCVAKIPDPEHIIGPQHWKLILSVK